MGHLKTLGVYGYDEIEPIILAALVTEDPLLLIGKAGTGKTYLLNSLSEALGLEHRHYNASLISFDDLLGFPYPLPDLTGIKYLETPGSVWTAESVLVDEISRCKPEHQNRLFSLIYERRIQGMKLDKLCYRWAAMNPCKLDQGVTDYYDGSVPLDQALADRFAFVVEVPDWDELDDTTRRLIADPRGDGVISDDSGELCRLVKGWQKTFRDGKAKMEPAYIDYASVVTTVLGQNKIRISPRRARQLVNNLLAVSAVSGGQKSSKLFRLTLEWSIPQRAWGVSPKREVLNAAHKIAWESCHSTPRERWLADFHLTPKLGDKMRLLFEAAPDEDTCTVAVTQFLARESKERAAAFAFALYPAALKGKTPIGQEGINELGKMAANVIDVQGKVSWEERVNENNTTHPEFSRMSKVLSKLKGARQERASQLFSYMLAEKIVLASPAAFEEEFDQCISVLRTRALS